MRITGKGIWGEPKDRNEAIRVLRRAVELGINFIDRFQVQQSFQRSDRRQGDGGRQYLRIGPL